MKEELQQHRATALKLLQQQDPVAFAELVRDNESLIGGLCQAMGLRGPDLDDAAAEAFAEIYQSLPRFQGQSSVSTWAYRIACRVIWRIRAKRSKRRYADLDDVTVAAESSGPEQIAEDKQERQRIWAAVAALEPRQATAVELYYRRGCSIEEIAQKLDCPQGTVKTLLYRARAILRNTLDGER